MYNVLTGCKANKNIDAKKAHKKATIIQSNQGDNVKIFRSHF